MSIKVNWLIVFLFCSVANAADNFRITEDGLYSKDGKLLNSEISTKSTTFSYSLRENAGGVITLYRDAFLNSSNGQRAMQFKKIKLESIVHSMLFVLMRLFPSKKTKGCQL